MTGLTHRIPEVCELEGTLKKMFVFLLLQQTFWWFPGICLKICSEMKLITSYDRFSTLVYVDFALD